MLSRNIRYKSPRHLYPLSVCMHIPFMTVSSEYHHLHKTHNYHDNVSTGDPSAHAGKLQCTHCYIRLVT